MTRNRDGTLHTTRTDRQPLTPPLRARPPLIRTRPPPPPPPDGDADDRTPEERRSDHYIARCRINDLVRAAQVARGSHPRYPTATTPLRG